MAFGLPPKYEQVSDLNGLNATQYLAIALHAVKNLNWKISQTYPDGFIAYTGFSMSSYSEEFRVTISGSEVSVISKCTSTQLIDWGKNKRNVNKFDAEVERLFATVTDEQLQNQGQELQAELDAQAEANTDQRSIASKQKGSFLSLFIPVEGYFVTPIIVILNILVFILMVCSGVNFLEPDTASLIAWGADLRALTINGQEWRLFTNMFLHIGVLHLLLNMYALVYIGLLLEPYLGKTRFATAYLLTGIAASVTSVWWNTNIISAGASGAIFGMYGVFLAMLTTNFIEPAARKALLTSIGIFVAYNLVNGMKAGIDGAAHIGGLVSGLIIGYAYYPSLKKPLVPKLNYAIIGAVIIITVCCSAAVIGKIPNDFGEYDKKMTIFADNEKAAIELLNAAPKMPHDQALNAIKGRGVNYWQQSIKVIQDADKLDVPELLHARDKLAIKYCELRVKEYNLIYQMENEHDKKYETLINDCNMQIKAVMDSLKTDN